jgi:polyphosphate kinase
MDLIEAETRRCQQGQQAEIFAKLNSLVDTEVIDALYRASQAGVKIRLNIRGICCLRPGVKGLSESIRVVSIVDRYLEHARILYFRHGGSPQLFISSADWMPRNLDRRIELLVPVDDPDTRAKLTETLLTYFEDDTNTWQMTKNGKYKRIQPVGKPINAQSRLYKRACKAVRASDQDRRKHFEPHVPSEQA